MRPDIKNDRMKFQTGLSFTSVYMKKSYRDGRKILVSNSVIKCYFILKISMAEKRSMEKLLLTGTLNTLLPADSSATSIASGVLKIAPQSRSGFGLGLALELGLGSNFPWGNFPST